MHLGADELEEYSMGMLSPAFVRRFEMHLLICHRCQDRLAEVDFFVAAMRAACAEVRTGEQRDGLASRPVRRGRNMALFLRRPQESRLLWLQ
jgi:hypothetical protein